MKKRIISLALALCTAISLCVVPVSAAGTAAKTSNIGRNNYDGNWARDIHSLLYQNSQGGLTRVEYYNPGSSSTDKDISVIVETYSMSFQLLSSKQIDLPSEIDRFGGAFHGEKYNYLIVGHDNRETESRSAEVMRVIQYDQDWNELDSASLTTGDTNMVIPFGHGLHCVEAGEYLHIHSDRYMGKWMANDGLNHETSLYVTVKQSDMSTNVITKEINNPVHISHSFAQYILVNDEGKIVMANHGDAYPRAFRLSVLPGDAESMDPTAGGTVTKLDVEEFMEAANSDMSAVNQTDAELGGLVEVGDAYVMVYKTTTTRYNIPLRGDYQNIYMARIPKDDLSAGAVQKIKLTDESMWIDSKNADKRDGDLFSGTPVLVPTGENTGYLMWTNQRYTTLGSGGFSGFFEKSVTDQMFILPYDATTSETFAASLAKDPIELKGNLSDCQPFVYGGDVVWYTTGQFKSQKSTMSTRTGYETTPVFYVFDGSSLTCYQDGKQVAVPSAFYGDSGTTTGPSDAEIYEALEKDKALVQDFLANPVLPTTVWTQEQFQSLLNNDLLKKNADPATGGQTQADVWYYQVGEDHVDVYLKLSRSGLAVTIMGKMQLPSQTENLGLVNPIDPNASPLGSDMESVYSARDFVKSRLGTSDYGVFGNDATADAVLKQAQDMLTRQKNTATVSWGKTGFSLTKATASADGKITGNLFFTDGTARCGLALEIPVKFNAVDNAALLAADKAGVQAALDAMNLTNDLTEEKVNAKVERAIINGSTYELVWPGFLFTKATASKTGSLEAKYVLTNGDKTTTINLKLTIPKIGDQLPDPPAVAEAMPTNDKLTVNGVLQTPTVYKIDGGNYFKLRDLAVLLNGTICQFDVGYDAATKSVTATSEKGYVKLDSDMQGPASGNQTATLSNDRIIVDGQVAAVTVYKIDGGNYFKLRDLGNALGFEVGWDDVNRVASITTHG